ncbi:MAG: insulinase family protein [Planctomycetes bacterium]|nr:insulinase family protein [Planctomycetota bacterium]
MITSTIQAAIFYSLLLQGAPHEAQAAPSSPRALAEKTLPAVIADRRAMRRVLGSGAVAYVSSDPAAPRVEARAVFRAGAYVDPPGKEGLAHLLVRSIPFAPEIRAAAALLGARIESELDDHLGEVSLVCSAATARDALGALVAALRVRTFDAAILEDQKYCLTAALLRRDDDGLAAEERAWKRLMRGGHSSTWLPSQASLDAITPADLAHAATPLLVPRNVVFAVSGPMPEGEITAALDAAMAGWAPADSPIPAASEPQPAAAPGVYLLDLGRPCATVRIRIGFPTIRRDHGDRALLEALSEYLGSTAAASRLRRSLLHDKGLVFDVGFEMCRGEVHRGDVSFTLGARAVRAAAAVRAAIAEIRAVGEERVSAETIATVRQGLIERLATLDASLHGRLRRFAREEWLRVDAEEAARDRAAWESMTADDWIRTARRYLDITKAVVLLVGDSKAIDLAPSSWGEFGAPRPLPE